MPVSHGTLTRRGTHHGRHTLRQIQHPQNAARSHCEEGRNAAGEKNHHPQTCQADHRSIEWRQMVAAAAYFRAEARGFAGGSPEQDWLDAESELMARLTPARSK
jgi:hypothetical protein